MQTQNKRRGYNAPPPRNYEHYFVPSIGKPVAEEFLGKAHLHKGESVLDVACGTGIVARLAAQQVGQSGHIVGIDRNAGMLETAKATRPNDQIEWREAPAERLPLDDGKFDHVLCSMSLQFFDDREKSLHEMRRVMDSSGHLAINVPGKMGELFSILAEALDKHVSKEAAGFTRKVFSIDDPEQLKKMLTDAGFRNVRTETKNIPLKLPRPEEFLWQYIHSTPMSAAVRNVDDEKLEALERDVAQKWQKFVKGDGMDYAQEVIFVTADK